jgi:hypothetical protein
MSPATPGPAGRRSLQDLLDEVGDGLVGYFFHETAAPHFSRSAAAGGYLPAEFTNWRDEPPRCASSSPKAGGQGQSSAEASIGFGT